MLDTLTTKLSDERQMETIGRKFGPLVFSLRKLTSLLDKFATDELMLAFVKGFNKFFYKDFAQKSQKKKEWRYKMSFGLTEVPNTNKSDAKYRPSRAHSGEDNSAS